MVVHFFIASPSCPVGSRNEGGDKYLVSARAPRWSMVCSTASELARNHALELCPHGYDIVEGSLQEGWCGLDACVSFHAVCKYRPLAPGELAAAARAWALEQTKTAIIAARAGNCQEVQSIAAEVQRVDPDVRVRLFPRDAAVRRCLERFGASGDPVPAPAEAPGP